MALMYARSDVAHVVVPPEGGGCGRGHSRPVIQGAPARIWRLDCQHCSNSPTIRADPLWAATISEIPETPDEKRAREDLELRGSRDRDQIMALALARLAGMPEAADSLQTLLSGTANAGTPHDLGATKDCPNGHTVSSIQNFCGECGHNFTSLGKAQTGEVQTGSGGTGGTLTADQVVHLGEPATAAKSEPAYLDTMKVAELREECKQRGLDEHGTKAELRARILGAGN